MSLRTKLFGGSDFSPNNPNLKSTSSQAVTINSALQTHFWKLAIKIPILNKMHLLHFRPLTRTSGVTVKVTTHKVIQIIRSALIHFGLILWHKSTACLIPSLVCFLRPTSSMQCSKISCSGDQGILWTHSLSATLGAYTTTQHWSIQIGYKLVLYEQWFIKGHFSEFNNSQRILKGYSNNHDMIMNLETAF